MAGLTFALTEQSADLRTNQRSYTFRIENRGRDAVQLLDLVAQIPEGVRAQIRSRTTSIPQSDVTRICEDLEGLVIQHLVRGVGDDSPPVGSEGDQRNSFIEFLLELPSNVYAFAVRAADRAAGRFDPLASIPPREATLIQQMSMTIRNLADAEIALEEFVQLRSDNDPLRQGFEAKVKQLRLMEVEAKSPASMTVVEPDSFYAATYVFDFPRKWFSPSQYTLSVEAQYLVLEELSAPRTGTTPRQVLPRTGGDEVSLAISPRPTLLTIVAILGAVLGTALKVTAGRPSSSDGIASLLHSLDSGAVLPAIILALVFFNVYEYSSIAARFNIGVNWRGALLIGSLCGLSTERILAAVRGFLGP